MTTNDVIVEFLIAPLPSVTQNGSEPNFLRTSECSRVSPEDFSEATPYTEVLVDSLKSAKRCFEESSDSVHCSIILDLFSYDH